MLSIEQALSIIKRKDDQELRDLLTYGDEPQDDDEGDETCDD